MKKRFLLYLILFISLDFNIADAQQFKWVKGGGTPEIIDISSTQAAWQVEGTYYMCTDANGNIYALSEVGGATLTADTFHSSGTNINASLLLTSYNCSGQMRFAKTIVASSETGGYGIAADRLGHIYVAGFFDDGNGPLQIGSNVTLSGHQDQYPGLIQFDTLGNFNWIQFIGDNTLATANAAWALMPSISLDGANNLHFIYYTEAGVHITSTLTSQYGTYDLQYNSSGSLTSVKKLQIDSTWMIEHTTLDSANGKLYVCGEKNIDFGTDQFFAAAFDTSRNLLWMYTLDTLGGTGTATLNGVVNDNHGSLYFCGSGVTQPTLGPTVFRFRNDSVVNALTPGYNFMSVMMKTDTNANPVWIKHYDGTSGNGFTSVTLIPGNQVAAAGLFFENVINGTDTLDAGVGIDPFFVVTDIAGNPLALKSIHGDGYYDQANVIVSDKNGNLYIGGQVEDSITAGGIPAYHNIGGNTDFFIMKYGYDCNCTAPVASYTHSTNTPSVNFTYTGTTTGLDSLVWNFGDGHTGMGNTTSHNFNVGMYNVCATAYTACGSDTYCDTVYVPESVNNLAAFPDLSVYPNPVSSELFISRAPIGTAVRLFNIIGQQVYTGSIANNRQQINTSYLPAGTYVLQFTGPDGSTSGITIIKQ